MIPLHLLVKKLMDISVAMVMGFWGRDGCIYALTKGDRILKIDTANNSHCSVRNSIQSDHCNNPWGDAILGIDGCIFWPPFNAKRTLKYDPQSNQTSLVGDNLDGDYTGEALATDEVIYCMLSIAKQVLAIDPLGEFMHLQTEHILIAQLRSLACKKYLK